MSETPHQSLLAPAENKFHKGNGDDGKHYWLTPPELYAGLDAQYAFNFDPCPFPLPEGFDGLTCEWGSSNYVNPPFGSIIHHGKKKGPTAWVRKAIAEQAKGNRVVLVYPVDKWLLMLVKAGAKISNLGDVKWLATEDGSAGKGTGRHIACFVLDPAFTSQGHQVRAFDVSTVTSTERCDHGVKVGNTCVDCLGAAVTRPNDVGQPTALCIFPKCTNGDLSQEAYKNCKRCSLPRPDGNTP